MRAAVFERVGSTLTLKDIPEPKPAVGDAVILVLAVPILGYAKQIFSGALPYPNLMPLVPGSSVPNNY